LKSSHPLRFVSVQAAQLCAEAGAAAYKRLYPCFANPLMLFAAALPTANMHAGALHKNNLAVQCVLLNCHAGSTATCLGWCCCKQTPQLCFADPPMFAAALPTAHMHVVALHKPDLALVFCICSIAVQAAQLRAWAGAAAYRCLSCFAAAWPTAHTHVIALPKNNLAVVFWLIPCRQHSYVPGLVLLHTNVALPIQSCFPAALPAAHMHVVALHSIGTILPLCSAQLPRRQHSYVPGLVLLYDKKRLHREVLAVHMEAGDHSSLISACIQYGDAAAGATCHNWHQLVLVAHTAECPHVTLCSSECSVLMTKLHLVRDLLLPVPRLLLITSLSDATSQNAYQEHIVVLHACHLLLHVPSIPLLNQLCIAQTADNSCNSSTSPHLLCVGVYNMSCFNTGGDPQLWAEALEYFCGQPGDCSSSISQVLQHIEQGELLPPLVVLQTLAKNKSLKVGEGCGC
jgi:hypothetical protein